MVPPELAGSETTVALFNFFPFKVTFNRKDCEFHFPCRNSDIGLRFYSFAITAMLEARTVVRRVACFRLVAASAFEN